MSGSPTPLRVAYLTGEYPRYSDVWLQREVAALRELGVEVTTFSVREVPEVTLSAAQRSERRSTTVLVQGSLPMIGRAIALALRRPSRLMQALRVAWDTRGPGWRATVRQFAYLVEAVLLAAELRDRRIDHLHNHLSDSSCTVAMLAAMLSDCPFSFTMHGPGIFFEPMRWRIDEKIRRAHHVVCISHFCRSQAASFVEFAHWEKLHIVHCGVVLHDQIATRDEVHAGGLMFVGRLVPVKGLPILFDALALLRGRGLDVPLTIVGDGPDRLELVDLVSALGLSDLVSFAGTASPEQVRQLLQQHDVFVLPSFAEGVPVVLMEAMAEQLPVITTWVAGIPELVEDGVSGLLVAPADAVALAAAIETLHGDAEMRRTMGSAGRRKVAAEFTASAAARQLLSLIEPPDDHGGDTIQ